MYTGLHEQTLSAQPDRSRGIRLAGRLFALPTWAHSARLRAKAIRYGYKPSPETAADFRPK